MTRSKKDIFTLSDIVKNNNTIFLDSSICIGFIHYTDYAQYSEEKLDEILSKTVEFTSNLNNLIQRNSNIWITFGIYHELSKLYFASGFYSNFSSFSFPTKIQKEFQKKIIQNYSSFLSLLNSRKFPLNKSDVVRFYQNVGSYNLPKKISFSDVELFMAAATSNSTLVTRDKDYLRLINLYEADEAYHFFNPGKRLTKGIYVPQNFSDIFPKSFVNRN